MEGTCLLCETHARLHASHVLPAFVFKALKNRSATGHIRHSESPNRRVQDGVKESWLCTECEARFSRWEREFSNQILHPWEQGVTEAQYSDWLLKFCVSVSWRVLRYCKGRNPEITYSQEREKNFGEAELSWREFLLDKRPHPGRFTQQFLIFDIIDETTVSDLPENINRFLMGAVSMDIVGSSRSLFTWAKLGRFQIFGVIEPGPDKFEGTKVHVKDGVLRPGKFVAPAGLLDLFREKASHVATSMGAMSDEQFEKIDATVRGDPDRFIGSRQFDAMRADVALFGEQAVVRRSRKDES